MSRSILVVGGGLAGLAATTALASAGHRVTLLEARPRLGGRAGSFEDGTTGQLIDACQHVSMTCCTQFTHFCRTVGVEHHLVRQPILYFRTPDGRTSHWQASPIPAPLHYASSFLGAHFLSWIEKIKIGTALLRLWLLPPEEDEPFLEWLARNDQDERSLQRFWSVVLVSALNESLQRMGTRYARQVFVEAFLRTRTGGEVYLPGVPLGELYGQELMEWLKKHHVNLQLGQAVRQVNLCRNRVDHLILRDGRSLQADAYVLAVAPHRLPALFEPGTHLTALEQVQRLEVSPITSVHFWHDRPITNLPHAVLFDRTAQWLFNRGAVSISPYSTMPEQDAYYTQVVISAARQLLPMGHDAIQHLIASELCEFFPEAQQARLLHCRVITEKTATFSVVPGIDAYRPHQATSIPNLFLAGDYTQTGWPATMEGAVRSGYLAAEQVIKHFSPVAGSC